MLIVDDNPAVHRTIRRVVADLVSVIRKRADGAGAVERKLRPDVVPMDI